MTRVRSARRGGFTLVELLVAIALAILLLSLVVGLTSSGLGSYRTVRSADRVSGWLLIAKSRAIRDGQPRGVRFFKDPVDNFYREAQYIEVPPPWVPNPLQEANPTGGRIVFAYRTDTSNPPVVIEKRMFYVDSSYAAFDANVQAGDTVVLPELGAAYQFTAIDNTATITVGTNPPAVARELKLLVPMAEQVKAFPDLGAATAGTAAGATATVVSYKFAFTARARPLFGEPLLQLSVDTAIDGTAGTTIGAYPVGPAPATFDVVFAPSGQVVGASSLIALWVRDPNRPAWPAANAGEQVLIGVYPKTGLIATHPPAPDPVPGKYQYVKDGLSSGL